MATPVWSSNWRRSGAATAMRLAPRMPKLTAPSPPVPTFVLIAEMWRTKLEEACVGCFAPQISGWNDSDGEPLALVYAQEHGAGLEACRRVARRGREAALCAEILRNGEVRHRFGVRCWPFC